MSRTTTGNANNNYSLKVYRESRRYKERRTLRRPGTGVILNCLRYWMIPNYSDSASVISHRDLEGGQQINRWRQSLPEGIGNSREQSLTRDALQSLSPHKPISVASARSVAMMTPISRTSRGSRMSARPASTTPSSRSAIQANVRFNVPRTTGPSDAGERSGEEGKAARESPLKGGTRVTSDVSLFSGVSKLTVHFSVILSCRDSLRSKKKK